MENSGWVLWNWRGLLSIRQNQVVLKVSCPQFVAVNICHFFDGLIPGAWVLVDHMSIHFKLLQSCYLRSAWILCTSHYMSTSPIFQNIPPLEDCVSPRGWNLDQTTTYQVKLIGLWLGSFIISGPQWGSGLPLGQIPWFPLGVPSNDPMNQSSPDRKSHKIFHHCLFIKLHI